MQSQSRAPDYTLGQCDRMYAWFPVVVGGLIGLGLGFLLELLSISLGLSLFTTDPDGARTLAISGVLGMLIGTIVTMYVTGFTAGFLSSRSPRSQMLGALYGFAAWCFSLILMVLLATAIGNFVAQYTMSTSAYPRVQMVKNQAMFTSHETARTGSDMMNPTISDGTTPAEKEVKASGMQSFIIFLMFFAGAASATYGGHCGYKCWEKNNK